jgi:hypothetical protein
MSHVGCSCRHLSRPSSRCRDAFAPMTASTPCSHVQLPMQHAFKCLCTCLPACLPCLYPCYLRWHLYTCPALTVELQAHMYMTHACRAGVECMSMMRACVHSVSFTSHAQRGLGGSLHCFAGVSVRSSPSPSCCAPAVACMCFYLPARLPACSGRAHVFIISSSINPACAFTCLRACLLRTCLCLFNESEKRDRKMLIDRRSSNVMPSSFIWHVFAHSHVSLTTYCCCSILPRLQSLSARGMMPRSMHAVKRAEPCPCRAAAC